MKKITLTDAQFETITELRDGAWLDPGMEFGLFDAFPRRDNLDNGHRRTVSALARKGLLEQTGRGTFRCPDFDRVIDACQEYLRHNTPSWQK